MEGLETTLDAVEPSVTAPARQYPYERRVIFFTSLGHGMLHFFELIYAGVLTLLIANFHLSLAEAGALVFPYILMLGLGSLPGGILADRWDIYKVFLLFIFGTSAAAVLAGLSHSVWTLALSFGLMGLFGSLYHPSGLALLSMGVRRKGFVMGLHGVFGSIGLAISPFVAGLLGEKFGWHMAFFVPAAFGFLSGILFLLFPVRISHRSLPKTVPAEAETDSQPAGSNRSFLFWLYMVMIITGLVYRGLMTYLPKYLGENVHVSWTSSVIAGGLFTSLALLAGGAGQMWGGHVSDRHSPFRVYVRLVPLWGPLLLVTVLLGGWPLVAMLAVFFVVFFSGQPIENQMLALAVPPRHRSTGYGLKFGLNLGLGALAAPILGLVGDRWGMQWIFYCIAGTLFISAFLSQRLRKFKARIYE